MDIRSGFVATVSTLLAVVIVATSGCAAKVSPSVRASEARTTPTPSATPSAPDDRPTEDCAALARADFPDQGYDSTYDPEKRELTIYAQGRTFLVDITDPVCVSSSPLISRYVRSAVELDEEVVQGTCESSRELLESGTTHVRGVEIDREAVRRFVEEECSSR